MFSINDLLQNLSTTVLILTALSVATFSFYIERLFAISKFQNQIKKDITFFNSCGDNKEILNDAIPVFFKKEFLRDKNMQKILRHYKIESDEIIENIRISIIKIGSIAALSPYIGLFGTVIGIMNAFSEIAKTGSSNFAYVSKGISEALIATAAGLFLAIAASFAYNHLTARLRFADNAKNSALEHLQNETEARR